MAHDLALVPTDDHAPTGTALVRPIATPQDLVAAMREYQATKDAILQKSDYQSAGRGQTFVKKSGWAKLAIAFGVSSEIVKREYEYDDHNALIGAEFVVRAVAPGGRYADGWGYCSVTEPRFKDAASRQKLKHDLPATAETRARNRAYSALFGHGEVSWEELDAGQRKAEGHSAPGEQRPQNQGSRPSRTERPTAQTTVQPEPTGAVPFKTKDGKIVDMLTGVMIEGLPENAYTKQSFARAVDSYIAAVGGAEDIPALYKAICEGAGTPMRSKDWKEGEGGDYQKMIDWIGQKIAYTNTPSTEQGDDAVDAEFEELAPLPTDDTLGF